jgi:hypothetical protein
MKVLKKGKKLPLSKPLKYVANLTCPHCNALLEVEGNDLIEDICEDIIICDDIMWYSYCGFCHRPFILNPYMTRVLRGKIMTINNMVCFLNGKRIDLSDPDLQGVHESLE